MPEDSVRLSSSEPEPLTLGELAGPEELARLSDTVLGYPHGQGGEELRTAIAAQYSGISAGDVVVFNGAAEAIFVLLNALTDIGDEVVTPSPGHSPFAKVPTAAACATRIVELAREDGYRLDLDRVADACSNRTRAIVLNAPHNPTGTTIDEATLAAAAAIAEARDITLVVDEVFRGLERPGTEKLPSVVEMSETAAAIGGLSKSAALAGIRIGWVVTRNRTLVQRLVEFRDYTTLSNSAIDERLTLLALQRKGELVDRVRNIAHANLALLEDFVATSNGRLQMVRPEGGLLAFPWFSDGRDAGEVAKRLAPAGVLMFPGAAYGDEHSSHFRVGYGRRNFATALERLDSVINFDKSAVMA